MKQINLSQEYLHKDHHNKWWTRKKAHSVLELFIPFDTKQDQVKSAY